MPLAEVHVTLKPALFDAQGETIKKALHQLGHTDVQSVRIGKLISVEINGDAAKEGAALQGQLDLMCRQLLANPVIEDYEVSVAGADPIAIADATALPLNEGTPATDNSVPTDLPGEARLQPAHAEGVTTSRQTTSGNAVGAGLEAVATPGGVTDPFQVDFASYEAMATEAKQSLRILALRKYGNWIEAQLRAHKAGWILCLGQNVVEHGTDIDHSPSDQHLLDLGVKHDRVPWVFNRPHA